MSPRSWRTPDRGRLAETRERFLVREPVEPNQVRDPILASWWRSREWNVPADRIELSYVRDPDLDTPLTRSAVPVLRHLRELGLQPDVRLMLDLAAVTRGPLQVSVEQDGKTRIKQRYIVTAPIAGRMQRIEFKPGDRLDSGGVLTRIEPPHTALLDPRAREESQARVDAAKAQVETARTLYQRAVDLKGTGIVAGIDLIRANRLRSEFAAQIDRSLRTDFRKFVHAIEKERP